MPNKPEIAFMDLDVDLFKACNAGEKIQYTYYDGSTPVANFDSAAAGKAWLEEMEVFGCDPEFGFEGDPATLTRETTYIDLGADRAIDAWDEIYKNNIKMIHECVGNPIPCKGYVSPATSAETFRDKLATLIKYKDRDNRKPAHLEAVRAHALTHPDIRASTVGVECDDEVQARAQAKGERGLLFSQDKDSATCVGCWLLNPNQYDDMVFSDPTKIGFIEWDAKKKKTKGWGMLFLLQQALFGDPVDSVLGVEGIGAKGAYNLLKDFSGKPYDSVHDAIKLVAKQYKERYGEVYKHNHWATGEELTKSWYDVMHENIQLVYMLKGSKDSAEKSVLKYLDRSDV